MVSVCKGTGLMNLSPKGANPYKIGVKFTIDKRHQLELYFRVYFKTEEKNGEKVEK